MPAPILEITLIEARDYVENRENRTISRATIYNWATKGRRGHVLKTVKKAGQKVTRKAWVDRFLDAI